MDNLEKYQNQQVVQNLDYSDEQNSLENDTAVNMMVPLIRHWRIVLSTFLIMCTVGLFVIWFFIKPVHVVVGAIRVAPILRNILSGAVDRIEVSNYQSFMNTQAVMITSGQVTQRVADDLVDKKMDFFNPDKTTFSDKLKRVFNGKPLPSDPVKKLKKAISKGVITAATSRKTELIDITMESANSREAEQIVNAFIRAYMAVEVSTSIQDENQKLTVLENIMKVKADEMERQRQVILQLGREYGDTALVNRHDMKLKRVASFLEELTKSESDRIYLETQVQLFEQNKNTQNTSIDEVVRMRNNYVNSDPTAMVLIKNIATLEQGLITAKQRLNPSNPELKLKVELINTLKQHLDSHKKELEEDFDKLLAEQTDKTDKHRIFAIKTELQQCIVREQRFRELLTKEDNETIELGRKKLTLQNLQDQLALNKETYDMIHRRIQELEMERKRPARISVAYNADIAYVKDKRIKFTLAIIFGSLGCGIFLALLRAKIDQSLYTPQDIVKCVNVKIIGTTCSDADSKKLLLPQDVSEDYQNICTNLGLLNCHGIPGKLVITSPGPKEGKTTLAINLAKNIAQTGKKVLLIDGDLRKPDIHKILDFSGDEKGLKAILSGGEWRDAISPTSLKGLDVLTANGRKISNISSLISDFSKSKYLGEIEKVYDHIIIDTPPVLAVPDALLWAKIVDGVILTTFAGHTEGADLKTTLQRFAQVNIKILGTVLHNVSLNYSYNPYGYGYNYEPSDDKKDDACQNT